MLPRLFEATFNIEFFLIALKDRALNVYRKRY